MPDAPPMVRSQIYDLGFLTKPHSLSPIQPIPYRKNFRPCFRQLISIGGSQRSQFFRAQPTEPSLAHQQILKTGLAQILRRFLRTPCRNRLSFSGGELTFITRRLAPLDKPKQG